MGLNSVSGSLNSHQVLSCGGADILVVSGPLKTVVKPSASIAAGV